jgi:hypothetical protein
MQCLAELPALLAKSDAGFLLIQADATVLEGYAVQFRYPGLSAKKAEARTALSAAERICSLVREKLGL